MVRSHHGAPSPLRPLDIRNGEHSPTSLDSLLSPTSVLSCSLPAHTFSNRRPQPETNATPPRSSTERTRGGRDHRLPAVLSAQEPWDCSQSRQVFAAQCICTDPFARRELYRLPRDSCPTEFFKRYRIPLPAHMLTLPF
jgi:hypothetical protein